MAANGNKVMLLLLVALLLWSSAAAEPLRLLVPAFVGKEPVAQHVRTSVYLEMIKAFRAIDRPDKGAWILYGEQPLKQATHDAVLAAASWPSVRADLAVWGKVHQYTDGAVVELKLTVTPLLKKRQVRPEIWTVKLPTEQGEQLFQLDLPGEFYEFEPLLISSEKIVQFQNPQGMPLYSKRSGGQQIGTLQEVIRFYEIHEDGILIATGGKKGWLRTTPLAERESEAIDFAKGLVRLLRGDWRGAQQSFSRVLANPAIPQQLRVHSLLYRGLAKQKGGGSGSEDISSAYALNPLDRVAASFLLMRDVDRLAAAQQRGDRAGYQQALEQLRFSLAKTRMLFERNDPWYRQIAALVQ